MRIWRISNHVTVDGAGGLRASARWHTRGRRIVYCAPNPATALLEILVHAEISPEDLPVSYRFLEIEAPDGVSQETVDLSTLPADWVSRMEVTQEIGNTWLASGRTAMLIVPCVIVPETRNILVNSAHPESANVTIIQVHRQRIDPRLARG